jgi:hypothetical protein
MHSKSLVFSLFAAGFALAGGSALAVSSFTETFDTSAGNWLNGASTAPTFNATGGVDNSGFISFSPADFNSGSGGFGDPLAIFFRGNASADASGDAFVGDWLGAGVVTLSLSIQHNYGTPLNFYARLAGTGGAGASLANSAAYTVAPNTWTPITITITDSNPPFASYGSSTFNGVFTNVQNLQFGFYLPPNTDISGLTVGVDNVTTTVPEPTAAVLVGLGLGLAALRRRR